MLTSCSLVALAYLLLMLNYVRGWQRMPEPKTQDLPDDLQVAIVIPARNEAENIADCLHSILAQKTTANLQIIVVDDHSTDATAHIVRDLSVLHASVSLLQLSNYQALDTKERAYKKRAIEYALSVTTAPIIITTDADCVAKPLWLQTVAAHFSDSDVQMVTAPVLFHQYTGALGRFQALDFCGMMGITAAGVAQGWQHMANGANLAFRRTAWLEAQKMRTDHHIASGDDMFLVQTIAAHYPQGSVVFAKSPDAVVWTLPQPDLSSLVQQRLRWGTKSGAYQEWKTQAALGIAWLTSVCVCAMPIIWLVIQSRSVLIGALILLLAKAIADFALLRSTTHFWRQGRLMRSFVPSFVLHTLYVAVIGTLSMFKWRYTWKERNIG